MTADPWPLAVLLHTVSAPNKRQEPGWANPPALVWSPDQEEHLRAAWQGDAIRATDVPDIHAGPITHARPAGSTGTAEPAVGSLLVQPSGGAHRRLRPRAPAGVEAVVRVADCARMIVKALREGERHPAPGPPEG